MSTRAVLTVVAVGVALATFFVSYSVLQASLSPSAQLTARQRQRLRSAMLDRLPPSIHDMDTHSQSHSSTTHDYDPATSEHQPLSTAKLPAFFASGLGGGDGVGDGSSSSKPVPKVLVLTPVKNAAHHLPRFFSNLRKVDYPHSAVSLAFLDSDSTDAAPAEDGKIQVTTWDRIKQELASLRSEFRRVQVFRKDFGLELHRHERHGRDKQLIRRSVLARSRNYLVAKALDDEDYVLWVDSDLQSYPADIIQQLLNTKKDVVVPNCVMKPGGRSYDLNSWKRGKLPYSKIHLAGLALSIPESELVTMSSSKLVDKCVNVVGGVNPSDLDTAGKTARASLREQALKTVPALAQLSESEWRDLNLPLGIGECLQATVRSKFGSVATVGTRSFTVAGGGGSGADKYVCKPDWTDELRLEGYENTGHLYLHKLRDQGPLVPLDGVGGAMLMIRADVHREGLVFPTFPYRGRIETEGLAAMAIDMGYTPYGLTTAEIIHH